MQKYFWTFQTIRYIPQQGHSTHQPQGATQVQDFEESKIEFADFSFDRQKVACYGLNNNAGGATTVLNFPSVLLADEFKEAYLEDRSFMVAQNKAQIVCFADYETVMRRSDEDARVRLLQYNRDFMMGSLAQLV